MLWVNDASFGSIYHESIRGVAHGGAARYNRYRWILFQGEVKFLTGGNRTRACGEPKVRDPDAPRAGMSG